MIASKSAVVKLFLISSGFATVCLLLSLLLPSSGKVQNNSSTEMEKKMKKKTFPTEKEFWPELENDLTRVKWAHAVNSKASLESALQGMKRLI